MDAIQRQFATDQEAASNVKQAKASESAQHSIATLSNDSTHASDFQDYETVRETIGILRAGRLIGEMSVGLSSTLASGHWATKTNETEQVQAQAQLDQTIGNATITAIKPCSVLLWKRDDLRALFFKMPSLAVGWYSIVSHDLVYQLKHQKNDAELEGYKLLLVGVLSAGTVSEKQRHVLQQYRQDKLISDETHAEVLQQMGWSQDDWKRGTKQIAWFEIFFERFRQNSQDETGKNTATT